MAEFRSEHDFSSDLAEPERVALAVRVTKRLARRQAVGICDRCIAELGGFKQLT